MQTLFTNAEIFRSETDADCWIVCAIDPSGDGTFVTASFSGTRAEQRAREYAAEKFYDHADDRWGSSHAHLAPRKKLQPKTPSKLRLIK